MLHASVLSFKDPLTSENQIFYADIPEDFRLAAQELKIFIPSDIKIILNKIMLSITEKY